MFSPKCEPRACILFWVVFVPPVCDHATFTHLPLSKPFFSSLWAQKMPQTTQKSFESLHISSICSSAHTLDLLWLSLLLSPAINFNQILCIQLYSCLKPSKALLLLRKPLPHYLCTRLCCLHPSNSPPSPSSHFSWAPRATPVPHDECWATYPTPSWSTNSLETHKKLLQTKFAAFKLWPSLPRPIMFN